MLQGKISLKHWAIIICPSGTVTACALPNPSGIGQECLRSARMLILSMCCLLAFSAQLPAASADSVGIEFFERKVRPIFVENCYKCHSADAEKIKGGFLLDTREGLLKGGDTGPAIVPGDPEKSLLIKAVRYTDENLQMPPKNKKLAAEQIADLEAWVKMGAPDPRAVSQLATAKPLDASRHWAFQPINDPPVPAIKN